MQSGSMYKYFTNLSPPESNLTTKKKEIVVSHEEHGKENERSVVAVVAVAVAVVAIALLATLFIVMA